MQKIHFSTDIKAPKEKVWDIMLSPESYKEWTSAFHEGSRYEGSWDEGSDMRFLGPDGSGMVSRIAENRKFEYLSIEHLGFLKDGKEDFDSPEVKAMAGARENYSFTEQNGITTLTVEMDTADEYKAMFEELWPKALEKLKAMCER